MELLSLLNFTEKENFKNLPALQSKEFRDCKDSDFPENCPKEQDFALWEVPKKEDAEKLPRKNAAKQTQVLD